MSLLSKKASLYETSDTDSNSNLERITKKFSVDLRNQVRKIHKVKLLSKEWFLLTDTLEHISKIANIEAKPKPHESPSSSFSSLQSPSASPKSNTNQTLWEKEQFCVRYMVEEGKVNLLLRLLMEWKNTKLDAEAAAANLKLDAEVVRAKMKSFEKSVGVLLKCCFASIEALQTLDTTELVVHGANILKNALQPVDVEEESKNEDGKTHGFQMPEPATEFETCQEFLVFEYLRLVFINIEDLQEDMIGKSMLNLDVVNLAIRFLDAHYQEMSESCLVVCSSMLAKFMDTEFFQTNREEFLPTDADKVRLVSLKKKFVKKLLVNYQRKRTLRPLMDNILRFEITHPSESPQGGDDDEFDQDDEGSSQLPTAGSSGSVILGGGSNKKTHVFSSGGSGAESSNSGSSSNPLSFLQGNRSRKNIFSMVSGEKDAEAS